MKKTNIDRYTGAATLCVLFNLASAVAQEPPPAGQAPPGQPPRVEERVEVVGITPIHGIGLPRLKVPANVQVFTADQSPPTALDVPARLDSRATSVQVSEAQAGTFQPDVVFRGFAASPLLGASQGLAVYQNGVRVSDPFGDTIQWDTLPASAIASINLMPGSNPLFGLNALGAALSLRTKDGFNFQGQQVGFSLGGYGRRHVEMSSGGHGDSFGYFVAGELTDESGPRDFSPSTIRRVFADAAWRSLASSLNLNVTAASNDLTGNGSAPVSLLESDRRAVFTHPDRTANDIALLTATSRHQVREGVFAESVAYLRVGRTGTFNGDAGDDDDDDDDNDVSDDDRSGGDYNALNNISRTRGRSGGIAAQVTRTANLRARENHFIAGGGIDVAGTRFDFASELTNLTPDRGTTRTGIFDDDSFVELRTRLLTAHAFVTDTWSVTDAVTVTGSARFNWTTLRLRDQIGTALSGDHQFGRLNPAVGMTYQVSPWLNVYGSYTQSSRVPTPVELTCADPEDPCRLPNAFVSDPPLKQVVGRTWEAGVRGTSGPLRWTLAAFTTAATDDIVFLSSGALRGEGHFQNIDRTRRRGIESTVEYDVADRVSAFAAYSLQHATFGADLRVASLFHPDAVASEIAVDAGDRLPAVPAHTAKLGLTLVMQRLAAGIHLRSQSGQFLRGDEGNLLQPVPGFAVVNAHARHAVTKRVSAVAHAQNIFNARYYTFGILGTTEGVLAEGFDDARFYSPGGRRAAWLGLEVRF
jgi:outer membrane receptor protein involved in Fe transport